MMSEHILNLYSNRFWLIESVSQTFNHQKAQERAAEAHLITEADLETVESTNVPVFDKSVDYIELVRTQNERMQKL